MKSVGCTLKLANDANDSQSIRECDLSIQGDSSRRGDWTLSKDSPDPRLTIGVASGSWGLNQTDGGDYTPQPREHSPEHAAPQ